MSAAHRVHRVDDLAAIRVERRTARISIAGISVCGDPRLPGAVCVHYIDLRQPLRRVAFRDESYSGPVPAEGCLVIGPWVVRQIYGIGTIGIHQIDLGVPGGV